MQSIFGQAASTALHSVVSSQNRICDFAIGLSQSGTPAGRGSAWGPAPARFSCSTCPPASRIYDDTFLRFYGQPIAITTARAVVSPHRRGYDFATAPAGAFRDCLAHVTRCDRRKIVACGAALCIHAYWFRRRRAGDQGRRVPSPLEPLCPLFCSGFLKHGSRCRRADRGVSPPARQSAGHRGRDGKRRIANTIMRFCDRSQKDASAGQYQAVLGAEFRRMLKRLRRCLLESTPGHRPGRQSFD